jgi:mono/diheme cytochrome c family protein
MKGFVAGVIATVVVLVAAVFAVSQYGLYPIGADNQPSGIERMLSMRAMDVYADKHKPNGDNPVLPTEATLTAGAVKYEAHCALCHGGAAAKISVMQNKFNPPAPQLVNKVPHDPDAWIFWVTKHGVRMTGMPSWDGVLSDGEIWQITAFIKHSNQLPPAVQAAWQGSGTAR